MARHAIDAARLAGQEPSDGPVRIRLPVDAPYVDAKAFLLQTVAEAGRCRAVVHGGLNMSTVVGFPADLDAVEALYTSLLVQAQAGMNEAARTAPAGSRPRSQSFRSAFLLAFTHRIGERLAEVNAAVVADAVAEVGESLLPVLAQRDHEVDDAVSDVFGDLDSSPVRGGWDSAGWARGRVVADNAALAESLDER